MCFVLVLAVDSFAVHSVFWEFNKQASSAMSPTAVYECFIILCLFLCRSLQNNTMKSPHSAYLSERRLHRPVLRVLTPSYILWLEYLGRIRCHV